MRFHDLDLICPACHADLAAAATAADSAVTSDQALVCLGCARRYPVLLGIPDLRLWPDPYIGLEEDRVKARMLAEQCAGLSFSAAVELYYRVTTVVPPFQARRFARSLLAAVERSAALMRTLEQGAPMARDGSLIDIGCGTAPLLVAARGRCERIAGVDIALRWLVIAQKRLAEAGLSAPLICACAEALPFRSGSFDLAVAEATLEHLRDQSAGLRECHRVLREGGRIFLATPNRHSLGPDPHTGLPAGAMLPRGITATYVRRKGGIPPKRHLLTARSLRRELQQVGFEDIVIDTPEIPAVQRASFGRLTRVGIDIYHAVKRLPGAGAALRAIGPILHAVARKVAAVV
jgi:ubiquinone/menaquinone biosynthesis C-methylase UbiE/uncharacterized protein YbaR (Trm112 family)